MDNIEPAKASNNAEQTINLPVLPTKAPKMGQTKAARWRTLVLTLVNVFMIAHLIQWLIMGVTISPIEPSEAMETLEVGVVNAGAIMFLLAIILTILFGRFFCGWLCHMVALQDLCAVVMARIGIRPKPFRSRLLMFVPLVLATYMFIWPTFKRLVLKPIFEATNTDWPVWLKPVNDIHHFSEELIVHDCWATMPPWHIAIIFLIVCGFVCVYFLGAKGFCTYACPYAGFFKPLDKIAITRIVVSDACKQCGYCTSACTSNVRVSEEVRDYGMVVDSGCMKTLDCVSACPNDALSLKVATPALFKKPRNPESAAAAKAKANRRYDLSRKEDFVAALVFLFTFYATRGLFDRVPMLMAGGLAAVITMLCVQSYWLFTKPNTRFHRFQLKAGGKLKPAGIFVILLTLFMLAGSLWSSHAKFSKWRGDLIYTSMDVPTGVLVRNDFLASPQIEAEARKALNWYTRADSPSNGGLGWSLSPDYRTRKAYFHTVLGEYEEALAQLQIVIDEGNPTDALIVQAGQLAERSEGNVVALIDMYKKALEQHPELHFIRSELAKNAWSTNNRDKALAFWDRDPADNPIGFLMAQAGFEAFRGNMDEVRNLYTSAIDLVPEQHGNKAGWYIDIARGASTFRLSDLMEQLAIKAIESDDATARTWLSAGELANALGQRDLSVQRAEQALSMPGADTSMVLQRAAGIIADSRQEGCIERGMLLLDEAHEKAINDYDRKFIIEKMVRIGILLNNAEALETAMTRYKSLAERRSEAPIFLVDYAFHLLQAARGDEAAEVMEQAANIDPRNASLAQRVSELYTQLGNAEKSQEWLDESLRRQEALDQ